MQVSNPLLLSVESSSYFYAKLLSGTSLYIILTGRTPFYCCFVVPSGPYSKHIWYCCTFIEVRMPVCG